MDKVRTTSAPWGECPRRGVGPQEKVQDEEAKRPAIFSLKACWSSKKQAVISQLGPGLPECKSIDTHPGSQGVW